MRAKYQILGLPKDVKHIGIVCTGYHAERPGKLERIDIDALVHYEKYGSNSDDAQHSSSSSI
jgi:hypothetical protein